MAADLLPSAAPRDDQGFSRAGEEVSATVDRVARECRARLIAFLASRSHDVAGAEDALADAFEAAIRSWDAEGIPEKPEAWLLTVARRRMIGSARHAAVRERAAAQLQQTVDEAFEVAYAETTFPDERLKLMFVCSHPAIDPAARAPLILQTVLGLNAARIAQAFLTDARAMGQRLVRAKSKIRSARIGFEIPPARDLSSRLEGVLDAIYVAYGTGWEDTNRSFLPTGGLAGEALQLGAMLRSLLPNEPEALGLYSLMLFCESRREARRDLDGKYVPLAIQSTSLWSTEMISRADAILLEAAAMAKPGRYQLEAAIQSVHADRTRTGITHWGAILQLYDALILLAPSAGARLARIAALAEVEGPQRAWEALQSVDLAQLVGYQPYWALKAHILNRLGRVDEAGQARLRAISLCVDDSLSEHLRQQLP